MTKTASQAVGWVERSETQRSSPKALGFGHRAVSTEDLEAGKGVAYDAVKARIEA